MTKSNNVAVLVLNYNGKHLLEKCLNSLILQDYKNFDIFVIDNGSNDDSIPFVKNNFPHVKIVHSNTNLGFAGGMNFGIKYVINKEYDGIFFLDNDMMLDKKCLSNLVNVLFSKPDIGICASTQMDWQGKNVQVMGGYFLNLLTGTNLGYGTGKTKEELKNLHPFEVLVASGGAMIAKTSLLKKIGEFDPRFFIYYEEVDLDWRAIICGFKIYNCPQAIVYHLGSATNSNNKNFAVFNMEKNRLLMYYKNLSSFSLIFILPIILSARLLINMILLLKTKDIPIFLYRIKGMLYFMTHFLLFRNDRERIQKMRVISDLEFFQKPFVKYSFQEAIKFIFS